MGADGREDNEEKADGKKRCSHRSFSTLIVPDFSTASTRNNTYSSVLVVMNQLASPPPPELCLWSSEELFDCLS